MSSRAAAKTWVDALLRSPTAVVGGYLLRQPRRMNDAIVIGAARHLFGPNGDFGAWKHALSELDREDLVPAEIDVKVGISHHVTLGRWLYSAVRVLRPDVVVETGVASGTSSWLILNALEKNGAGTLYSIDLPNEDPARPYRVGHPSLTGRAVSQSLRSRWRLELGDSRELLPRVLEQAGRVDLFLHDSEHTYEAMTQEFEAVLPALADGGLIVSDDVQMNAAFTDVTQRYALPSFLFRKGGTARGPLDSRAG